MPEALTSRERVLTVIDGRIPDRVPVDLHNFLMTAQASGLPFPEFFQNGEAMAEGQINAWREFGHDLLLVENGTAALAEACGVEVEYLQDSAPVSIGPALTSADDVGKLRLPDPYRDHPLPELLKATRIVASEVGEVAAVMGRADQGPFSLAAMIFGMVEFLTAIGDGGKDDLIHALLEFSLEASYRYAVAQFEQGAMMTSVGESLSGPDVCSPAVYRRLALPYQRRLVDRLKVANIPLALHICGNATPIVADMADTGAAILELDYKIDLEQVKAATAGKTTVLGPIDPSGVLARGTSESVEYKARAAIEILGPGGGLILGPGCALPPETPAENVHALVETARRFGRYRATGELDDTDPGGHAR